MRCTEAEGGPTTGECSGGSNGRGSGEGESDNATPSSSIPGGQLPHPACPSMVVFPPHTKEIIICRLTALIFLKLHILEAQACFPSKRTQNLEDRQRKFGPLTFPCFQVLIICVQEERLEYERLLQAALADRAADAELYEQRLTSLRGAPQFLRVTPGNFLSTQTGGHHIERKHMGSSKPPPSQLCFSCMACLLPC